MMKNNFEKHLDHFIEKILESIFEDLIDSNIEVRIKEDNLCELNTEMKKVLMDLNEQQQKTITEYIKENERLTSRYYNYIYKQGFKDCVQLLKSVEIL